MTAPENRRDTDLARLAGERPDAPASRCARCGLLIVEVDAGDGRRAWIHGDAAYDPFEAPHAPRPADEVDDEVERQWWQAHG